VCLLILVVFYQFNLCFSIRLLIKFSKRQCIVIGPTPPGTGERKETLSKTSLVLISPLGAPTSITTEFSLTKSLPIIPGSPVALIRISASCLMK